MTKIVEMLKVHEGVELKPYKCTADKLTIGIGRNLDDNGITMGEAEFMLRNDLTIVESELYQKYKWANELSAVRKDVLMDMYFNLGGNRFAQFKNFIAALERGDYEKASEEMLDSRWARQVGERADRLSHMMKANEYPKMWRS